MLFYCIGKKEKFDSIINTEEKENIEFKPENLKPAEDLKKLERRVKLENKKIADSNKLPKEKL